MLDEQIPITFHKTRNDEARQYEQDKIRTLLWKLAHKIHNKSPITGIEIGIDFPKNMIGKGKYYDITIKVLLASGATFLSHGKSKIAKTKGVGLESAIREGLKDIEAQYRKTKKR